jgi:deazaflavin-dependent oxidoreductase (nitroreductase family)
MLECVAAGVRRPGPVVRRILRAPALLYDWHAGWLLGRRFLRLTHVGRRSGRRYRTVLEVIASDRATGEVVVIAGLGPAADWYRNIQAQPAVEVAIGRQRFRPVHRILGEPEAVAVLADYERRNRWVTPVVRRVLTWLVGWTYDGSDAARRRLVHELPVVGFRPEGR